MKTLAGTSLPNQAVILWEYEDGVHHLSCGAYALDTEDAKEVAIEFARLLRIQADNV